MQVETAMALIGQVIYRPGWSFECHDHCNRFEGTITVKAHYPAQNTNRDQAAVGYAEDIMTYAEFPLVVEDITDDATLYRRLLFRIMRIEEHEAREYLRIAPTNWAPFHPHKVDGMKRWQQTKDDGTCLYDNDLQFGVA